MLLNLYLPESGVGKAGIGDVLSQRAVGTVLGTLAAGPLVTSGRVRGALKRVFPAEVPPLVLKLMFSIEHRTWFGFNRLKNEFSVECLVTAWGGH